MTKSGRDKNSHITRLAHKTLPGGATYLLSLSQPLSFTVSGRQSKEEIMTSFVVYDVHLTKDSQFFGRSPVLFNIRPEKKISQVTLVTRALKNVFH